jgi:hypothetical protein
MCAGRDTLSHRLLECRDAPEQWAWMKARIARILGMDQRWIPDTWVLRPQFKLWPAQNYTVDDSTVRGIPNTTQK